MKLGISTASYFTKRYNEDALPAIRALGADTAEVFFAAQSEYKGAYLDAIARAAQGMEIWSVHAMTTQFEPQLFSAHDRARTDALAVFDEVLDAAARLGAGYYTFHGQVRYKRRPYRYDYDAIGARFVELTERAKQKGVGICYENVHYCYYHEPSFFAEMAARVPELYATFDVKQAWQAGLTYQDFLPVIAPRLKTVHLCDFNDDGRTCLPGQGKADLDGLIASLVDHGFDGRLMLEVYPGDYSSEDELRSSYEFVRETVQRRSR